MPPATDATPRRVVVTGATGFIGSALVALLRAAGHTVLRLTRRPAGADDVRWDPARGEIDAAALDDAEAVIHLAGENIGERWTDEQRRRILDSRVQGTALLARSFAALARPPRVFVSGSATGIYGDSGDREVDEHGAPGAGFLSEVVQAWEAAAEPARAAGLRVVHPRLGIVLHESGGALARMLPVFRLGVGGRLGSGRQWMSWISRDDAVRALAFLALDALLDGPVNVVAPEPVRNADFTHALGHALGRPAVTVVPGFALTLAYGRMAEETLLTGQRVRCDRLLAAGFTFHHPTLDAALRAALGDG